MASPPFDAAKAHRWFAIELNNKAWDLIEAPARTAEEVAAMLSAAHASRYHWSECGTILNHLRSEALVAAAYLAAGQPELARNYAQACLNLCEQAGDEATPFDLACAAGGMACALAQLGERDAARTFYAQAKAQIPRFEHADDKEVFEKFYPEPA